MVLAAQPSTLTLPRAVEQALRQYPAVRVSQELVSSVGAGIRLARTAYLPRVDVLAQLNRATRNNVYGMLLPQSVIPAISGPPLPVNSPTNVWGSAVGFLVSWEPFDFGFRRANLDSASLARRRAETAVERTKLEVATSTIDGFLTLLAAQQTRAAAQAGVRRAAVFHEVVSALVKAELRPGADAARSRAESALAETQRIRSDEAVAVARAELGLLLGAAAGEVLVEAGPLLELPRETPAPGAKVDSHPLIEEQQAEIEQVRAQQRALDRSWFPRFQVQTASYARGTGANPDFTTGGGAAGLGPNVHNWGLGMSVSFPVLELAALRARKEREIYRERAETARLELARRELDSRLEKARAVLESARLVARNTPVQLEAARAAEQQANARYRAGLGNLLEVAEAQRLLTLTEIDDSLARLHVWRAMLAVAAATGDVDGFLKAVGGN